MVKFTRNSCAIAVESRRWCKKNFCICTEGICGEFYSPPFIVLSLSPCSCRRRGADSGVSIRRDFWIPRGLDCRRENNDLSAPLFSPKTRRDIPAPPPFHHFLVLSTLPTLSLTHSSSLYPFHLFIIILCPVPILSTLDRIGRLAHFHNLWSLRGGSELGTSEIILSLTREVDSEIH